MTPIRRLARGWTLFLLFVLLRPAIVAAAPDYLRFYKTGMTAEEGGNWEQVDDMMRRAIELNPEERRRRVVRRSGYFPHYYLGLARYHLRDCSGALAAWAESERQGVIVGRDEYAELLRLQSDCEKNGTPSAAVRRSATGGGSSGNRSPVKSGARTGQKLVEDNAAGTSKALGVVENVAPNSDLGRAASQGQKVVDVAEAATDVVDLILSPKDQLKLAVDAYFAGNPSRTLQLLSGIDTSDPRGRAQVYLFRAAASYRLHLIDGNDAHLGTARTNAKLFRGEQWSDDFPTDLFDPRFVRFMRGGG